MRRREIFEHAAEQASRYLDEVGERPVSIPLTAERIAGWRALLGGALRARGAAPTWPLDALMRCAADGGVVGSTGPRYFHYESSAAQCPPRWPRTGW